MSTLPVDTPRVPSQRHDDADDERRRRPWHLLTGVVVVICLGVATTFAIFWWMSV